MSAWDGLHEADDWLDQDNPIYRQLVGDFPLDMYMPQIYSCAVKDVFAEIIGFDWDDGNRDKNYLKHDVHNGECEAVFFNQPLVIISDPKHSRKEKRYAAFGVTDGGRRLTVIFTLRKRLIRVVSARDMNAKERRFYEKQA